MTGPVRELSLNEGGAVDGVTMSFAQASALNATKLVTVLPTAGAWRVTAAYAVGALHVGDVVVRVAPKIGAVQVLRLLARAHGVKDLKPEPGRLGLEPDGDLTAALAVMFAAEAATALADGPPRGYRTQDETLPVLRGRLRMREQERRRFGLLHPLEVTLDEWTVDTDGNRRLREAVRRLLALPGVPSPARRRLLHTDRQLADVALLPPGQRPPTFRPTRLDARLHALHALGDLVLAGTSVEHRAGSVLARGFVLDMARVFELLVAQLLREARTGLKVQDPHTLDEGGHLTIKPDLVLYDGVRPVAVADTKYKLLGDGHGGVSLADAYQLLAYALHLGLHEAHLIYPGDELEADPYVIRNTRVQLVLHCVPLDRPLLEIGARIQELAKRLATGRPVAA